MKHYYFHLRGGGRGYRDETGLSLADDAMAICHARQIATELVRNREKSTRHWRVIVVDEDERPVHEARLIDEDRTLDHLDSSWRRLFEELAERYCALEETMEATRQLFHQARAHDLSNGRLRLVSRRR